MFPSSRQLGGRGVVAALDSLLEGLEAGFEFLDFSELQGEGHGIAGCPEAEGWVGALHNFCEDGETAWQKGLGLLTGEVGGLLAVVGQLLAETQGSWSQRWRVVLPMPESRAAWVMVEAMAMAGRADCWRKVRVEIWKSVSFAPISAHSGSSRSSSSGTARERRAEVGAGG